MFHYSPNHRCPISTIIDQFYVVYRWFTEVGGWSTGCPWWLGTPGTPRGPYTHPGYTTYHTCQVPPYRPRGAVHRPVHGQPTVRQSVISDVGHMRTCDHAIRHRRCITADSPTLSLLYDVVQASPEPNCAGHDRTVNPCTSVTD